MRHRGWLAALLLGLCVVCPAALAEEVNRSKFGDFFAGMESECAVVGAFTAIGRLPAVRIVVFDPVSNSFAFVACPDMKSDPRTVSNRDYLDRHRLALTTQKIRLLIMPYNPFDGDLTLQTFEGEGVEFPEIAGLPPAPAAAPAGTSGGEGREEEAEEAEEPPSTPEVVPGIEINQSIQTDIQARQLTLEQTKDQIPAIGRITMQRYFEWKGRRPQERASTATTVLSEFADQYRKAAVALNTALPTVRGDMRSIQASLDHLPRELSRRLSRPTDEALGAHPPAVIFSLERDVFLEEVKQESDRRLKVMEGTFYQSPFADGGNDFDADARELDRSLLDQHKRIAELEGILDHMEFLIAELRSTPPSSQLPQTSIRQQAERFETFVEDAREFQDLVVGDLEDMLAHVDEMRDGYRYFRQVLSSPAMHIQRFNFPPLESGKSLTFRIERPKEFDGKLIPIKANDLVLKSAPAYTLRFGTGLVTSELENPTFKAVQLTEAPATGAAPNTLVYDDRGNGKVVPGIFIHHYYGRRSPLLRPTLFEKLMPTLSLGLPIAEADLFTQFFLGLDWEIVTGFDLNVGYHFGKVNGLVDGIAVGMPLPTGVQATSVVEEKFDSAFYFGIVINRDAFDRLFRKTAEEEE